MPTGLYLVSCASCAYGQTSMIADKCLVSDSERGQSVQDKKIVKGNYKSRSFVLPIYTLTQEFPSAGHLCPLMHWDIQSQSQSMILQPDACYCQRMLLAVWKNVLECLWSYRPSVVWAIGRKSHATVLGGEYVVVVVLPGSAPSTVAQGLLVVKVAAAQDHLFGRTLSEMWNNLQRGRVVCK